MKAPLHFQFCLGVVGGMDATPYDLQLLINEMHKLQAEGKLPAECTWSAFGIGKGHLPVMFAALANEGHIRVGMEDNVVYGRNPDGTKIMATNLMLVQRAANAVKAFGNEVATPAEAREMLGLKPLDTRLCVPLWTLSRWRTWRRPSRASRTSSAAPTLPPPAWAPRSNLLSLERESRQRELWFASLAFSREAVRKMEKGAMGFAHRSFFASKGAAFGDTFTKNHFFCLAKRNGF